MQHGPVNDRSLHALPDNDEMHNTLMLDAQLDGTLLDTTQPELAPSSGKWRQVYWYPVVLVILVTAVGNKVPLTQQVS